jgi:hypothetical protein
MAVHKILTFCWLAVLDNSDDSGDSSSSSKAWIAGAVIAAVVALTLAIEGFIFLWKGKKSAGQISNSIRPLGTCLGSQNWKAVKETRLQAPWALHGRELSSAMVGLMS